MFKKQSNLLRRGPKKVFVVGRKKKNQNAKLPPHQFKKVKVKRGLSGLGLFASENIKNGEMIIEYIGNILNEKEAEKIADSMYLFEINKNKTIDGTPLWNIARYCNHSCGPSENAESDTIKGHVIIKAIKDIKIGEEITYDYGQEFFDEHIKKIGCKCPALVHVGGEV